MNTPSTVLHRNVNVNEEKLQQAVHLLDKHKYSELTERLETAGFPLDEMTDTPYGTHTLLGYAVEKEDIQGVETLLNSGANPNILENGSVILNMLNAATKTRTDILRMLLEKNALFLPDAAYDGKLPHQILLQRIEEIQEEHAELTETLAEEQNPKEVEDLRESIKDLETSLYYVRRAILIMSPYLQKFVKTVSIKTMNANETLSMKIDTRVLGESLYEQVAERLFSFPYPAFDLVVGKQSIPRNKALTDFLLRDGMTVSVVPMLKTGKGGKRKTRKHRKN
jgi:hypothetical protein